MSRSWDQVVRRLTPAEIDYSDRWGERCGTGKCAAPATHCIGYRYVTGRRGRTSHARRLACEAHAQRFATRNGVVIADAPEQTPPRPRGLLAAAAAAFDPDPERVSVQRDRRGGWCVREAGHGFIVSGAFTVALADAADLDQATAVVEVELGSRRRLVPAGPWHRQGDRATTTLARAEDTATWSGTSWALTVWSDGGVWRLRRVLAEQFRPEVDDLGNTGMDLARAVRTADALLRDEGWTTVASWAALGDQATGRATRTAVAPVGAALDVVVNAATVTTCSGSGGTWHG